MAFGSPLVSIIIPLFNREDFITETLVSLQNQSYTNWEAMVVDDGSTDHSMKIVHDLSLQDSRIQLLERNRLPKGANVCRNIGLAASKGEYVIFLDSDDLLAPFCLEQRVSKCDEFPKLDMLVFQMLWFNKLPGDLNVFQNIRTDEPELDRFLGRDMVWLICSPIWKRSSLIKIGSFDEDIACFQESELHTRALLLDLKYEFFDKEPPDCYYRMESTGTISSKRFSDPVYLESQIHIVKKFITMLRTQNGLTQERKNILGSILLKISSWWFILPQMDKKIKREKSLVTWQLASDLGLVNVSDFFLGKLYIKWKYSLVLSNLAVVRNKFESFFSAVLLKKLFRHYPNFTGKIEYMPPRELNKDLS